MYTSRVRVSCLNRLSSRTGSSSLFAVLFQMFKPKIVRISHGPGHYVNATQPGYGVNGYYAFMINRRSLRSRSTECVCYQQCILQAANRLTGQRAAHCGTSLRQDKATRPRSPPDKNESRTRRRRKVLICS